MYEICAKTFLEGTYMCAQSFLVCTRVTACVHAHMCSLAGTLVRILRFEKVESGSPDSYDPCPCPMLNRVKCLTLQ